MAAHGIGPGEAEALVLARATPGAMLLVDDGPARHAAAALGIRRVGSAGILVAAKLAGIIDVVRPRLDAMVKNRTRLSRKVIDEALRQAGE